MRLLTRIFNDFGVECHDVKLGLGSCQVNEPSTALSASYKDGGLELEASPKLPSEGFIIQTSEFNFGLFIL